jgi:hypothetical protein
MVVALFNSFVAGLAFMGAIVCFLQQKERYGVFNLILSLMNIIVVILKLKSM